jgi:aminoglycoside N3'-acetyltransferase
LTALHLWRWERDFPKVEPLLRDAGAQRNGPVGQAVGRLVKARAMRDLLVRLVRRDPLFLLSDAARRAYERR